MQATKASVLLLTFNQEHYVAEALQSLLAQKYEQLEVVISDDASQDDTWALICKIVAEYQGEKRIVLNRNESNLGVVGNYFRAFSLSAGDVIFTAAGDDISLPDRCGDCIKFWSDAHCKDDLVATDAFDMLESGEVVGLKRTDELESWDFARWSVRRPFMFGASHMMTRRLLSLAELDSRLPFEDQSLLFRSMLMGEPGDYPPPW